MGVHDVQEHRDAQSMRLVDQRLELLRGATARRGGKEVCYVVPKRPIVRVLLHSHQLQAVVALLNDARQHVVLEVGVGGHHRLL